MEKTRVLLADMRPLLRGMLARIIMSDERIHLVGHLTSPDDLAAEACRTRAHVVISGDDDGFPEAAEALIRSGASMRVLTVAGDGSHAVLLELKPQRRLLGELSLATLLAALTEDRRR